MNQELLYDYFYEKAFQTKTPVSVVIELLTRCNFKCEHCYLPSFTDKGLKFEEIKGLLHDLRKIGVVNVTLTGGEIFLRKDIFEIIKVARDLNMRVFLLSNASLLTREKIIRLAELNIAEFSTTLFSTNEEVNDTITKKSRSHSKIIDNLKLLREYGIKVLIKTPIMKKNVKDFMEVKKFCDDNDLNFYATSLITSKNNGDKSNNYLRIDKNDFKNVVNEIDNFNPRKIKYDKSIPCRPLHYSFSINCKGDVFPCNSFYYKLGNIFESSIETIWYDSKESQFIRGMRTESLSKCGDCSLLNYCDRCPGVVYLESNDLYSCDGYAKSVAKVRVSN